MGAVEGPSHTVVLRKQEAVEHTAVVRCRLAAMSRILEAVGIGQVVTRRPRGAAIGTL